MSDATVLEDAVTGLRAGETGAPGAVGPVTRLAKALTPNLRPDPRAELRDMSVKKPLRTTLEDRVRSAGLTLDDEAVDDPYADSGGNTLKRLFSVLRSATDQVVLLQIPAWLANDGASVGALEEVRDVFTNRKVRIVAEDVQTPALSLLKTMPRIWRDRAKIDLEFVSWRYVVEFQEGKLSAAQAFGLDGSAAPAAAATPADNKKPVRIAFISSTGLDLRKYREAAREVCMRLQFFPLMMEEFEVMGSGATEGSKKKVDLADLYVGIFAHRYGYIEDGYTKSVTEIEFDYAGERKLERLCFVVDPTFDWPPNTWDPEHHLQMTDFKKRVDKLIRAQFTTTDNFKQLLMQALIAHLP